jgi:hypothetical protein
MRLTPYFRAGKNLHERGPKLRRRKGPGPAQQLNSLLISSRKRAELIQRCQENFGLDRPMAERRVDQWLRGLGIKIKE